MYFSTFNVALRVNVALHLQINHGFLKYLLHLEAHYILLGLHYFDVLLVNVGNIKRHREISWIGKRTLLPFETDMG